MKKIIIIGGGIAGLSAGIFAQTYGFESEIFESHSIVGGECTGWNRNGFHIDNCIQWLTGTKEGTSLYKLWEEVGMLGKDVELIKPDRFYTSNINGTSVSLYRDIEKTRKELLKISPDDKKEINSFIDAVKSAECINMPADMPMDMISKTQLMKMGISMMGAFKYLKKYSPVTIKEFSGRFKSSVLRIFFSDYFSENYSVFALVSSYATFTSGNGDIPKGGSLKASIRMAEKYKSLGGNIHTDSPVSRININGTTATGITLENGETVSADYIIPACDTDITFGKLMDRKYMPKELLKNYENLSVTSSFQISFGADDTCDFIYNTEIFDCNTINIAGSSYNRMSIKNYNYEPSFAPSGKTVLQSHFSQNENDYDYWENLYCTDKTKYNEIKQEIAQKVMAEIISNYPQLEGKLHIIDIVTPYTYNKFTGAYKGSYMNFSYTPQASSMQALNGFIEGLDNVVVGSQWLQSPGGLPVAVTMGKFAAQRIAKKEWS